MYNKKFKSHLSNFEAITVIAVLLAVILFFVFGCVAPTPPPKVHPLPAPALGAADDVAHTMPHHFDPAPVRK